MCPGRQVLASMTVRSIADQGLTQDGRRSWADESASAASIPVRRTLAGLAACVAEGAGGRTCGRGAQTPLSASSWKNSSADVSLASCSGTPGSLASWAILPSVGRYWLDISLGGATIRKMWWTGRPSAASKARPAGRVAVGQLQPVDHQGAAVRHGDAPSDAGRAQRLPPVQHLQQRLGGLVVGAQQPDQFGQGFVFGRGGEWQGDAVGGEEFAKMHGGEPNRRPERVSNPSHCSV